MTTCCARTDCHTHCQRCTWDSPEAVAPVTALLAHVERWHLEAVAVERRCECATCQTGWRPTTGGLMAEAS